MKKLHKYLRMDQMPTFLCPGCTHGIAYQSMLRTIDKLALSQEKTIIVCAIGCAGRLPLYLDFPVIRTCHGRALPVAQGVKLANPDLNVIVFMGDGDAAGIGGNHLIHSCRRNFDITAIVASNEIYGMTGGQYSPTTGKGKLASTAPFGMIEPQMDICKVAMASGASFVARGTAYHVAQLDDLFEQAITHKGFSLFEILTTCPTHLGRRNKIKKPADLLLTLKDTAFTQKQYDKLSLEDRAGKLVRGVLHQEDKEDYISTYDKITGFTDDPEARKKLKIDTIGAGK
jgi:2-oxoglutarate/2-oxoacid ferredoxin oxidoreductase subunit beta